MLLIKIKHLYIFLLFSTLISCTKEKNTENDISNNPGEYGLLKLDIAEIEFKEENLATSKLNKPTASFANINDSNNKNIHSSNSFQCKVELKPVGINNNISSDFQNIKKESLKTVTTPISKDVRYRVYVFEKESGNFVTSEEYIRGQESSKPIKIIGGKTYTIVSYSINSKTAYPEILENYNNIKTAEITNNDVDFIFSMQDVTISKKSTNTLKIKFRHTFTQITTTIKLDETTAAYSYIRNVSSATFIQPSYNKTKFKVSTQTITGIDKKELGAPVVFPFIDFSNKSVKSITSSFPTIINSPATDEPGKMIIEALTIGGVTRGNLVIDNLNLTPGVKYNLILTFKVPETTEVLDNPFFEYYDDSNTNGTTTFDHSVELNNPTYGAQLDIYYLDNSFQLFVNEKPVFSREINFEDYLNSDVIFTDGTWYGSPNSGTAVIYNINREKPRKDIPIIRLVIDENGLVTLFGRKKLNEQLRVLNFRNNVTYSPVQFIPNGKNTLKFRSTNWTITDVWGRIYGIRVKTP